MPMDVPLALLGSFNGIYLYLLNCNCRPNYVEAYSCTVFNQTLNTSISQIYCCSHPHCYFLLPLFSLFSDFLVISFSITFCHKISLNIYLASYNGIEYNPLMVFHLVFFLHANVTRIKNCEFNKKIHELEMQKFGLEVSIHKQFHQASQLALLVIIILWHYGSYAFLHNILNWILHFHQHQLLT